MRPLNTGTCRLFQDEVEQNTVESSTSFFLYLLAAGLFAFMSSSFFFSVWLDDTCCVALGVASHLCCTSHESAFQ